jgi:hypothetical protein
MKLVENAKSWYKMFSIQAQIAAGSILGSWSLIPEDLKQHLPQNIVIGIAVGLLALGVVGRLVKQNNIGNDPTK